VLAIGCVFYLHVAAGYLERIKSAALAKDTSATSDCRVALAALLAYTNTTYACIAAPLEQEAGLHTLGLKTQPLPSGLPFAILGRRLAEENARIANVGTHLPGTSSSFF
jgi:hypothetical protein